MRVLVGCRVSPAAVHPLAQSLQDLLGFFLALAQDDEVVRVAHHLPALLGHQMVQRVEVDVGQQRTDYRALRRARLGRLPSFAAFHHALLEQALDQFQHGSVGDLCFAPAAISLSCGMLSK